MNKKTIWGLLLVLISLACYFIATSNRGKSEVCSENDYLVIASESVMQDAEWAEVANAIASKHNTDIVTFTTAPREALAEIRKK